MTPRQPRASKRMGPAKQALLPPPPELSEEDEKLLANHDLIEFNHRCLERLRQQKKLTPEQRKRLAEQDRLERRIEKEPKAVLAEARGAIDRGTSLLLELIRSGKLAHRYGSADGGVGSEWDDAIECLSSRLNFLNRELSRLARGKYPQACRHLWFEALALTQQFVRLAVVYPEEFRRVAESSLTMPSLRSRNPKYTADADAIVRAIHLAEKHPAGEMTHDKERIGELCGYLVANILDSLWSERRDYEWEKESVERLRRFQETAHAYRDMTVEESLRRRMHPTVFDQVMASARLPEFQADPKAWWKLRIKPMIREEFHRLKQTPALNAALWQELGKLTDNGKDGAKWKALHDNCRNKVNQLARRAGARIFA